MTAKEYLNRVRMADRQIKIKTEELYHLRLNIAQISPQATSERVKSSSKSDFMKTVDRIVDLQSEINAEIDELVKIKTEARNKINALDDERYTIVLTEYYLNCKTWQNVIKDNYISERTAYRLHGLALQEFRKNFGYE